MIKLIASDLDGTLLNNRKEFAPDFFEIIKKLNEKQVKFSIASGRSKYTLEKVFGEHKDEIFYISDNGGYVSGDGFDEVILPLTREQMLSTVEVCLQVEKLQVIVCAKDKCYFVRPDMEYVPIMTQYYSKYEIVDDYTQIKEQILKVAGFDPLGSAVNGYPKIKDKLDKNLAAVVSSVEWLDIMNKDLNKGVALKRMQQYMGITEDETMAFGDFNNDIELLKAAKFSYAVENATNSVKQAAKNIAPSNDDFGVAKVIKEKVLGMMS